MNTKLEFNITLESDKDIKAIEDMVKMDNKQWDSLPVNKVKIINYIHKSSYYIPELSFVAYIGEQLGAHLMFTPLPFKQEGVHRLLLLGPLTIHPNFQKQGLGTRLVTHALQCIKQQGYDAVFVNGHDDFYLGLDFVYHTSNSWKAFVGNILVYNITLKPSELISIKDEELGFFWEGMN